jgi:diguanylate cyclase (GGDEF)-like protein
MQNGPISILIRAGLATIISMIGSLAVVAVMGFEISGAALWLPILCPLFVAFPVSSFTYWQQERLRLMNEKLRVAQIELEQAHAELADKARRDVMTGFLNREAFFSELDATRRKPNRGALLLVDADHFKRINDSFGHLVGDDALLEIAAAIGRATSAGDLIGRIGGEEFAVFLAGANGEEGERVAERIRAEVEAVGFMPAHGEPLTLTISVGGTVCWTGATISELMRQADRQLYRAKNAGRNRVMFESPRRLAA